MSRTALQVITRGLRALSVLQSGESPSADMAADGLEVLNGMLHAWELDGINLNHTDLALTDTLPYPENHIEPIVYNFASTYASEFGKVAPPDVLIMAGSGYRNLQHYYLIPKKARFDSGLHPYYAPNRYAR